jgi:hypothetical protein
MLTENLINFILSLIIVFIRSSCFLVNIQGGIILSKFIFYNDRIKELLTLHKMCVTLNIKVGNYKF